MNGNPTLEQALELHRAGRLDQAAAAYEALLERDPNDADAAYGLGTILRQQGQPERAAALLNAAVSQQPGVPEFVFNHALALEDLGETEHAKAGYLEAASLTGGDPVLLVPICRKLLGVNLPQAAFRYLNEIVAPAPEVLMLKAKARGRSGDWLGGVEMLRKILQAGSHTPDVWRELSTAAAHLHDFDTAISAFDSYLAAIEPDGADMLAYADLLLFAQKLEQARSALAAATDMGADPAQAAYLLARVARLDGDTPASRRHLETAVGLRPTFGDAWGFLLETEPAESLPQVADRCRDLSRGDEGTEHERITLGFAAGRAYEKLSRYAEAFDCFRTANERHKALLIRRHSQYEPERTAANFERIAEIFAGSAPRAEPRPDSPQPIFIVGMPRSGTTLVERILSCLDGVTACGEMEAMEFVAARYYRLHGDGSLPAPGNMAPGAWEALAEEYWRWAGRGPGLITDKMPHNFRNVGLIANIFPAAPVVWMRRDPRDVCLSIYSRKFPDGHPYATDPAWLAHFFAQSERLMTKWSKRCPGRVLEVVYEDLVEDPEGKTRELAAFCRLDWDPACLRFDEQASVSFTFSEMQVRQPLNREGIGRWRHYGQALDPVLKALTHNGIS